MKPGITQLAYHGVRRFLGVATPGRNLRILPDDVFLVSFPKSGNTWTRFLLGNLIFPDRPMTFGNIDVSVPCIWSTSLRDFDRVPRPRVIKSHECFDPRYPRVIYIVRDPRDVVISQYHYYRKVRYIGDDVPIETFVDQFVTGKACRGPAAHGSWGQNVLTWLNTSEGDPRFLMLRYEDMLADTCHELEKIAAFLGLNATAAHIHQAVERSSAGRMRKLEQAHGVKNPSGLWGTESRKDLMFVRAAVSGGWRTDLSAPLVHTIEATWGPVMQHLGYELTRSIPIARTLAPWNRPQLKVKIN